MNLVSHHLKGNSVRLLSFSTKECKVKTEKVTVEIFGGLGNQLFMYSAGFALASRIDAKLILNFDNFNLHEKNRKRDLLEFKLNGEIQYRQHINNRYMLIRKALIRCYKSQPGRLISRVLNNTHYYSNVVGFDPMVYKLSNNPILHGYFQTYRYLDESILNIRLLSESNLLTKLLEEASESSPISVHVRRGDYESHKDSFGLLSGEYFSEAIQVARSISPNSPIWVFSDEIDKAKTILTESNITVNRWFGEQSGLTDAETLWLMSKTSAIVLSNSSFSWWAAKLNPESKVTIAPQPWFKNLREPDYLVPPEWVRIGSNWEI